MQLADFYQFVSPELPGCPDETIRRAIIGAVQSLCKQAHVWRELQDPVRLIDGVRDYAPDVPPGARLVNIDEVFCGGKPMTPTNLEALKWKLSDWEAAESTAPVYYMSTNDWGSINVYPLPRNPTDSITIRAEFEPINTATSLPDFIMQRYQNEIEMGVKARCMMMPRTTWADAAMGEYWRTRFQDAVTDAEIKMIHDRNSGSIRVQPIRFG